MNNNELTTIKYFYTDEQLQKLNKKLEQLENEKSINIHSIEYDKNEMKQIVKKTLLTDIKKKYKPKKYTKFIASDINILDLSKKLAINLAFKKFYRTGDLNYIQSSSINNFESAICTGITDYIMSNNLLNKELKDNILHNMFKCGYGESNNEQNMLRQHTYKSLFIMKDNILHNVSAEIHKESTISNNELLSMLKPLLNSKQWKIILLKSENKSNYEIAKYFSKINKKTHLYSFKKVKKIKSVKRKYTVSNNRKITDIRNVKYIIFRESLKRNIVLNRKLIKTGKYNNVIKLKNSHNCISESNITKEIDKINTIARNFLLSEKINRNKTYSFKGEKYKKWIEGKKQQNKIKQLTV